MQIIFGHYLQRMFMKKMVTSESILRVAEWRNTLSSFFSGKFVIIWVLLWLLQMLRYINSLSSFVGEQTNIVSVCPSRWWIKTCIYLHIERGNKTAMANFKSVVPFCLFGIKSNYVVSFPAKNASCCCEEQTGETLRCARTLSLMTFLAICDVKTSDLHTVRESWCVLGLQILSTFPIL